MTPETHQKFRGPGESGVTVTATRWERTGKRYWKEKTNKVGESGSVIV